METNNEYKGLLGCFPDTIGVHKVRQSVVPPNNNIRWETGKLEPIY